MEGNRHAPQRNRRVHKESIVHDVAGRHDYLHTGHRIALAKETAPNLKQHSQSVRVSGRNSHYDHVQNWLAETGPELVAPTDLANSSWRQNGTFALAATSTSQ